MRAATSTTPTTAQSLGALLKSARDIMRKDKVLNGEMDRLPMLRSAAVPGCGLRHRPGASSFGPAADTYWRRDAAATRRRRRLRCQFLRYKRLRQGYA